MKTYILLENAQFYAYHGVMPHENKVGNTFVINLRVEVDWTKSGETDELNDTISYADLFNLVKEEMTKQSKLLENVIFRIVSRLRAEYPSIGKIEVKLSKQNPPVGESAQVEYASVELIDEKE